MPAFEWKDGHVSHITADGKRLETLTLGPAPDEAPTIVMLHEGLGCVELWRDFPQKLARATDMGVLVYSRAGYGKSDPTELPRPLDYMTREAMDVLPDILNAAGIKSCVLLGHSDGASIAAIYAGSTNDHRVRGLVLMAPHFFTEPDGLASIAEAKIAYETGDLRDRLARYHEHVDVAFRGWNDAWGDEKFKQWNISEVIDYLRIPVLAMQGRQDQYGTLAQIKEIENHIYSPVDVEILEDCGHAPHLEKPEHTLGAVVEFCERLVRIEREVVALHT